LRTHRTVVPCKGALPCALFGLIGIHSLYSLAGGHTKTGAA